MNSFEDNFPQLKQKSPWNSLIILILLFFAANVVGQFIAIGLAALLTQEGILSVIKLFEPPYSEKTKIAIYTAQAVGHFLGFTAFSLFFIKALDNNKINLYLNKHRLTYNQGFVVVGITFFFMIFNSIIIEWNMNIEFPEFLREFEDWARNMEDQMLELTKLLSTYNSFGEMLLALVIIAVLPALGEELVFRGLLQTKLHAITKNAHAAIWIAAVIFGAFHMQFYGVVPRILLGALFGYLYFYSGNLWYAILAHFINNGLAVLVAYIGPRVDEDWDATEMDSEVPIYLSIIGLIACGYLFSLFYKTMKNKLNG